VSRGYGALTRWLVQCRRAGPDYHSASYSCANAIYDIAPDVVTAFRINNNVPETVYWTAWLQKQVGSSWVTVPGSNTGWLHFPARPL
jgi:hypothetical protein